MLPKFPSDIFINKGYFHSRKVNTTMADRKPNSGVLDADIKITISPRKALKGVIVLLLFLGVFALGRWSVDVPSTALVEQPIVEEVEELEVEGPGTFSRLTGFLSGIIPDFSASNESEDTEETTETEAVPTESNTSSPEENMNSSAPETNTTVPSNTSETPAAEETEPIITSYSTVALALNDVSIDWKTTWGKITKVDYTIKNNEDGTIEPAYFKMMVEGYDDYEKKIPLPLSSKSIKAGKSYSANILIPQGFSYSESATGNLESVDVTLILYDGSDKIMTSYRKSVNLQPRS